MSLLHLQNIQYKLILFDFDGTIADTSLGILDAHKYTIKQMGLKIPSEEEIYGYIGFSLLDIYTKKVKLDEKDAREAIDIYRRRYAQCGIHMASLYNGVYEIILYLKKKGYKLGIATLKVEKFVNKMLDEFKIQNAFDIICGMDEKDKMDKNKLICRCMETCNTINEETILIGDSYNDFIGAKQAGVDFVGVTYGFGYRPDVKYDIKTISNIVQLKDLL